MKVKKGEKRIYTQFLLNEDKKVWEGPFDLDTPSHHLIRHNNTVHPNEDSWRLTREKEVLSSAKAPRKGINLTRDFRKLFEVKGSLVLALRSCWKVKDERRR